MPKPIAILSAPGSRGDVNPMVAIGVALKARGFDVAISVAEPYAEIVEQSGLEPHALISQALFDSMLADPSIWRPLRGARAILSMASRHFLQEHFQRIRQLHRPGRTVLVAHPLDLASRIHRDWDPATPLASIHLSPVMVRSASQPPRLSPWWFEPRRPPWLIAAAYHVTDRLLLDRWLAPDVNRLRRDLNLPPIRRILDRWWLSPDLVLALYPPWFDDRRPESLGSWHPCGFPSIKQQPAPIDTFAIEEGSILFTPGTANRHAKTFFADAVRACQTLGRPGVLATSFPEQVPDQLPQSIRTLPYVPLNQVLPQCSVIVHHGGVGTMAAAVACGVAQLICPMAFDQFFHAERIHSLGLGDALLPGKVNASSLAHSLRRLLSDRSASARCDVYAARVRSTDGAAVAASHIAQLLETKTAQAVIFQTDERQDANR